MGTDGVKGEDVRCQNRSVQGKMYNVGLTPAPTALFMGLLLILMGISTGVFAEEVPFTPLEGLEGALNPSQNIHSENPHPRPYGRSLLTGFTLEDRDRLIRLEATLKEFKESVAKQFEQVAKQFEQVDKRNSELWQEMKKNSKQADKRNSDLRQEMDKRISELRQDMNKRFDQLFHFLYILSGIFTALVVAVIGFAYWDRRTIIKEARREAIEFMEKGGMLRRILDALRELSREDTRLAEALRRFNLL